MAFHTFFKHPGTKERVGISNVRRKRLEEGLKSLRKLFNLNQKFSLGRIWCLSIVPGKTQLTQLQNILGLPFMDFHG